MLRKIYSYLIILTGSLVVLVSCDKSDDKVEGFSTVVDVSKSSLVGNKYNMVTLFSTDNGVTYKDFPKLSIGKTYKVKVIKRIIDGTDTTDTDIVASDYFQFDWTDSSPKPAGDATKEVAEFAVRSTNKIVVKIASNLCTYDPSLWVGTWKGVEDGTCCSGTDVNVLTQDSENPNKITMNNFWGDGVDAYMIFSKNTNYFDQIVTLPEQTTSEGGVASGSGTYDQCKETFSIDVKYVLDGKTYAFNYAFHK